jgi:hypothetical protein
MKGDILVNTIFDAIRKTEASPDERRIAVIRAGLIAQTYAEGDTLTEQVFASCHESLQKNDNLNLRSGVTAINGGTH